MLWNDKTKLIICINEVGETITTSSLSLQNIGQLFDSLRLFHLKTNHVHRDIHPMNILTVDNKKLFFNDFALAVPIKEKHSIRGSPFFSSDRVLFKNEKIEYYYSDDLFSLTFSLIYMQNYQYFSQKFSNLKIISPIAIYQERSDLLNNLSSNKIIFKALNKAKTGDYEGTKQYILQYFQTLHY